MKRTVFFGLLAIVLAFGFIGCGGDNDDDDDPVIRTYQGTDGGDSYELKINEDDGTFELTVGGKTSKGTATKSSNIWTLTPNEGTPFTVTVNGTGGITNMDGEITFTDGSKKPTPDTITPPVTGSNPFKGTWTATWEWKWDDSLYNNQEIYTWTFGDTTFEGSNTTVKEDYEGTIEYKGNYTHTSTSVTITYTEVNWGDGEWISVDEEFEELCAELALNHAVTLSGGKIILQLWDGEVLEFTRTD